VSTAELYETMLRSQAEGMCAILGRTAIAFLGFVDLPALSWLNGNGLYVLFAFMSAIAVYTTYTISYPEEKSKNLGK
jgi:hypothetical protein